MNIRRYIPWWLYRLNRRIKTKDTVDKFISKYEKSNDEEIQKVISYVKKNGMTNYPNTNEKKYYNMIIRVFRDDEGYPYVLHKGKKLFFPMKFTDDHVKKSYRTLLHEQDSKNSHHYLEEDRFPQKEDIVADIGAAEGIFALDVVDKCEKIYLFEMEENWTTPLEKTFALYKDKIEIVKKYVSNKTDDVCVTLDDFFRNKKITYIKADIEGAEVSMLEGGRKILATRIKRALICTYHRSDDEKKVTNVMTEFGFEKQANDGYLCENMDISTGEIMDVHDLRRGVCYFFKSNNVDKE